LGGNGLDDVAVCDVRFESTYVRFIAGSADVGGIFLVELYRGLRGEGDFGGLEGGDCGGKDCACSGVSRGEGILGDW